MQGALEKWKKKILSYLPKNLDELAKKNGVLQRKRGIRSTASLFKILFLSVCSNVSFRILAYVASALEISNISNTAWRKHFSKAAPFLREILHDILSSFLSSKTDIHFERNKKCTAGGRIYCVPAGTAAYPSVLFFESKPDTAGKSD